MFFDKYMNPQAALGGALSGNGGGMGSLANLIAMGAPGGGAAPMLPQPGAIPQSGPSAGPIPPAPQPQQSNLLQMLMQMDPARLSQMLSGMGMGGGQGAGMANGSAGLIGRLLQSPDFSSFGQGSGAGGRY